MPEKHKFSGTNQKPERRRTFGTGLVRHCPQGLFSPFFTFLRAIYFSGRLGFSSSPLSAPGSPRMPTCSTKAKSLEICHICILPQRKTFTQIAVLKSLGFSVFKIHCRNVLLIWHRRFGKKDRCAVFGYNNDLLFPEEYTFKFSFSRKARLNTERVPPGHPIILFKSNKFNMAAVSVKRSINMIGGMTSREGLPGLPGRISDGVNFCHVSVSRRGEFVWH